MNFEEWYATPASTSANPKDWYRECWLAAQQSAAEAQRESDAAMAVRTSARAAEEVLRNPLVTEKPE